MQYRVEESPVKRFITDETVASIVSLVVLLSWVNHVLPFVTQ